MFFSRPPISWVRNACFGCKSLCFHGHLYSTTTLAQLLEHWHVWMLSRLAQRNFFFLEINNPLDSKLNLWCLWLSTFWYASLALFSFSNPHVNACGLPWWVSLVGLANFLWYFWCSNYINQTADIGLLWIIIFNCCLTSENLFAFWCRYKTSFLVIPFFTLPLLQAGVVDCIDFCIQWMIMLGILILG